MAEATRGPVILVGGNMGRNDGVDYRAKLEADFPAATFISVEGDPAALERRIAEADAVIGELPERLLSRAARLRWVQTTGAGANAVTTPAFAATAIVVTSAVGVHVASVPEQTLAMLLAFARRLPEQILNQHGAHRWYWPTGMFEVEGQTIGILGYGKIGQALARKARGLGMRVVAWRRSPWAGPDEALDRQFPRDDLRGLLADADHVVVTLPLTAETRGLLGAAELRAMKRGAYLYNVGRGPIVDTDALLAALQDGTIAGAGLDVTDPEPLPPDHPLWDAPNLILTTHYGGLTPRYGPRAYAIIAENVRRFLAGEELLNVVDKGRGY
jgi:phosphoglycerate dehydrogenase-like enzyme